MGDNEGKTPAKKGKAKPPQLPPDAPQDVKDFVDCKSDRITIDPTKKGFLPEIPIIGAPNVTIEPVAGKPGTAKVTLKKAGLLDTSFTMTVTNGHLDADTTGVTPQAVKDAIDKWVKRYNAWLDANNRRLDGISVDKGKATITKVAVGEGKGGGVKKAVGVGVGAVLLGTGAYLGVQALGSDGGGEPGATANPSTSSSAPADTAAPEPAGVATYTCDQAASCGAVLDALLAIAGVAISHDGSPGSDAPSDAEFVGVTTWEDTVRVVAECGFGPTTGEAMPGADGVFQVHLPLYAYGPCEVVELQLKLKDGVTFSDGVSGTAIDFTGFDVTEVSTEIDPDLVRSMQDGLGIDLLAAGVLDTKVVADVLTGTDLCFVDTLWSEATEHAAWASLCTPGQTAYGLTVGLPGLEPLFPTPVAAGAVEITGFERTFLDALFGPGGPLACGAGDIAVTVCPEPAAPDIVLDQAVLVQAVPLGDPAAGPLVIDFGDGNTVTVDTDGAEPTVEVEGAVEPYVVIRNKTMSVFVPGYRTRTISVAGGPDLTPWPAVAYAGSDGPPQTSELQDVRRFAARLARSLASDDKTFALEHLDPAVLQVFPTECPAHLASLDDPTYRLRVLELGATGTYRYAPPSAGGAGVDVPGVLTAEADVVDGGETRRTEVHFGAGGGDYSWFADCGS